MANIRNEVLDLCACFEAAGRAGWKDPGFAAAAAKELYKKSTEFLGHTSLPITLSVQDASLLKQSLLKAASYNHMQQREKLPSELAARLPAPTIENVADFTVRSAQKTYGLAVEYGLIKEDFTL